MPLMRELLCICGNLTDDIVEIVHRCKYGKTIVERCQTCAQEPLCYATITGIHSRIISADEEDFFDNRVWFPTVEGLPPYQVGYCVSCKEPFFWSVDKQRWMPMESR